MKRLFTVVFALLIVVSSFSSCHMEEKKTEETIDPKTSEIQSKETVKETITEEKYDLSETLKTLCDNNLYAFRHIFEFNCLEHEETPFNGSLCRVTDPKFNSVDDIENFLKTVYVQKEVTRLSERLNRLYKMEDGVFSIDLNEMGGKGYYVIWDNYTLSIDSCTENECVFTVTAIIVEPGEEMTQAPYNKTLKSIKENNTWLLESFFV